MPHWFVDRPRLHALADRGPDPRDELHWETVNTAVYLVGGVLFVWGSVLIFPRLETRSEAWAAVSYLLGGIDNHRRAPIVGRRAIDAAPGS